MHDMSLRAHRAAGLLLWVAAMSGCATVTNNQIQSIHIDARTMDGDALQEAACTLSNDKGQWSASAPGSAMVIKSAADLFVRCEKEEHEPGTAVAISRVNNAMFGNILIGGVIGAAVDHSTGTGYEYPSPLTIEMGSHRTIDLQEGNPVMTSSQPSSPASGGARTVSPGRKSSASMDDLKDLLPSK